MKGSKWGNSWWLAENEGLPLLSCWWNIVCRCKISEYHKNPKNLDTWKFAVNHSKIQTRWLYHSVVCPKDEDTSGKQCGTDQTYDLGLHSLSDLSVQNLRIITVYIMSLCCNYKEFLIFSQVLQSVRHLDRVKRIWYLSLMRAAKVQASLCIRAVSPEPPLLAHTSIESRETFRQKARSLAALNGWACAVKICHDGMLEDTNSFDGAHFMEIQTSQSLTVGLQKKH